jgi:hypothetical protein
MKQLKIGWYLLLLLLIIMADVWIIDDVFKLLTERSTMAVSIGILSLFVTFFLSGALFNLIINKLKEI